MVCKAGVVPLRQSVSRPWRSSSWGLGRLPASPPPAWTQGTVPDAEGRTEGPVPLGRWVCPVRLHKGESVWHGRPHLGMPAASKGVPGAACVAGALTVCQEKHLLCARRGLGSPGASGTPTAVRRMIAASLETHREGNELARDAPGQNRGQTRSGFWIHDVRVHLCTWEVSTCMSVCVCLCACVAVCTHTHTCGYPCGVSELHWPLTGWAPSP